MGNNTEKPATIAEKKKHTTKVSEKQDKIRQPHIKKEGKSEFKKDVEILAGNKEESKEKSSEQKEEIKNPQEEPESSKESKKEKVITKPKEKRNEAAVSGKNLPISTRKSMDICRFIMKKKISKAIEDLEEVLAKKRALPMKGEIPHKKGIMSGGYPKNATEHFIKLLKNLQANSNVNEIEEPVITKAIANMAPKIYGRFGRWKRKRTHVMVVATERKMIKLNKKENIKKI